jgi:hypothetical protein
VLSELVKFVSINKQLVGFQNASAFFGFGSERAERHLHFPNVSASQQHVLPRSAGGAERPNSSTDRTHYGVGLALCWIAKYLTYAARVTLKLCVELLMRVVCCAFDCRRSVAFCMAAARSRLFAM